MKRHILTPFKFNCDDCDYSGDNEESMDVIIKRNHSVNVECSICFLEAPSK